MTMSRTLAKLGLLFVLLMVAVTVELLMQELIKTLLIQQSEKVNENESDD